MLEVRTVARPLSDAERDRIIRAHARIPGAEKMAREVVSRSIAERDDEIAAAVKAGASQTDIAHALGLTRQAVYNALRRADKRVSDG